MKACHPGPLVKSGSFTPHWQQVVYKHHQNFTLTKLRNQMSFENEVLHTDFYEMLCFYLSPLKDVMSWR